ncbi:MAG TPA: radical SAM protein [Dehalococcoidia bacterium]|nr:radical SAM protein [Dehalococcoidia bacterium]
MKKEFVRPEICRPPSEADSYYLPLTAGCSNHSCIFCRYYGYKMQMRDFNEVKLEIDAMHLYLTRGIKIPGMDESVYYFLQRWDGRRIFLQDGDALIYPYARLVEIMRYLNEKFPHLERIASYTDPSGTLLKTVDEFKTLKDLKLGIVYLGVESGDEELLKKIGKNVNYEQMVAAGRKIKEAGITLSVTVLLGLGGREGSEKHALATARIISDIDSEYCGALTLTLVPGTPLYEQAQSGQFHMITPFESLEELKMIIENSNLTNCFFSSVHASNYITVRGTLPADKEKMIRQIKAVLQRKDPGLLRPEYLRGL